MIEAAIRGTYNIKYVVFSTQYCHKGCAQEANQQQLPIIGRSERGT